MKDTTDYKLRTLVRWNQGNNYSISYVRMKDTTVYKSRTLVRWKQRNLDADIGYKSVGIFLFSESSTPRRPSRREYDGLLATYAKPIFRRRSRLYCSNVLRVGVFNPHYNCSRVNNSPLPLTQSHPSDFLERRD